jgi:hypothetical protein
MYFQSLSRYILEFRFAAELICVFCRLINQFLDDHPLFIVSDEIKECKKLLGEDGYLKLSQKTSSLSLKVTKNKYYFKVKVHVPNDYPIKQVSLGDVDSNFPRVFKVWFLEQARELARRQVEPPLRKKSKEPFEPKPSLAEAVKFIIKVVKRYPDEKCQACGQLCFPEDPDKAVHNENAAAHVERIHCLHAYHHDCLILYMKTPPFEGMCTYSTLLRWGRV